VIIVSPTIAEKFCRKVVALALENIFIRLFFLLLVFTWPKIAPISAIGFIARADAETLSLQAMDVVVPDADEYFSDVWGAGKNFSSQCDFGFNRFVFDKLYSDGEIAVATNPQAPSAVLGIAPIPEQGTPIGYREDCGRLALRNPISADKYSLLSYNASLSNIDGYRLFWSHDREMPSIASPVVSDSYKIGDYSISRLPNVFEVRSLNLKQLMSNWSGQLSGLSFQANSSLPRGATVAMDWFRLVDPEQSPVVRLTWQASDFPESSRARVSIYADRDNSHFDGFAVARNLPLNGSFDLLTGIFPPGRYHLYAVAEEAIDGIANPISRSDYSVRISVDAKPSVSFISPTRMSGVEYSRDERLDAWDMSQTTDVANYHLPAGYNQSLTRGFHRPELRNGVFTAVSDFDPTGAATSVDTQVILATGHGRPIDPRYYRYFCYRLQLDTSNIDRSVNAATLHDVGYFSRLIYAHNGTQTFGSTGAFETIESSSVFLQGLNTYCIDLWDQQSIESGTPWLSAPQIDVMRFDPLESRFATAFALDWAGLYGENHTVAGDYLIELAISDAGSDKLDVELYVDKDSSGFDGILVAKRNKVSAGKISFNWRDVQQVLPEREYYLYAVVRDSRNVSRAYSEVPIVLTDRPSPAGARSNRRTLCDYDGDGRTEYNIIRPDFLSTIGSWYLSSGALYHWGFVNSDIFIEGDFDGDLRSDVTVVRKGERVNWYSIMSSNAQTSSQLWGERGDVPLSMKRADSSSSRRVVFRPSNGVWYSLTSERLVELQQWGLPGDVPLPADFDGDGDDDYAIWRPGPALWAIRSNDQRTDRFVQWGLPGDVPFVGDYTGDAKADLVVWRPWNGTWYVCRSESNFSCSDPLVVQFGLPGDMPVQGDWDGDSILDVAVWRPASGTWYTLLSSSGVAQTKQWGLPGDFPLCSSMLFTRDFSQ
jgi:hypothetical protein